MDLIQRTNLKPETRLSDNRRLTFYAALYDVPVTIVERGKTYREIIRRGAFDESLRAGDRVVANIDHRTDEFARTPQLLLQSDKKGLFATVWLDESDDVAERVKNRIERGELKARPSRRFRWRASRRAAPLSGPS
jgi:HK97 family phage prohead protease